MSIFYRFFCRFMSHSVDETVSSQGEVGEGNVSGGGSLAGDDLDASGDIIDDGYVGPNMSYVPEGLDDHQVGATDEDLLKGDDGAPVDDSFEV